LPRLTRQYLDLSVPVSEFRFTVNLPEEGTRLDVALRRHYPWRSREHFQAMIERGEVLVNGARRKPSLRLRRDDVVRVRVPVSPDAPAKESSEGLVVLYEDDALVAVDKPAGMVAHPTGRIRHGTLINLLHARYRRPGASDDVVPRLAHRIDRDTSGVVLVVKDRRLDAIVTRAFHHREVSKTYLALVQGVPGADAGRIDAPIGPAPDAQTKLEMAVCADGRPSRTRWRVRMRGPGFSFVELEPKTGRTHQLRVHLRSIGHPIVCDHLYGDLRPLRRSTLEPAVRASDDAIVLDRLALHAHRLELLHPVTRRPLVLESPVPADLVRALAALEQAATRKGAGASVRLPSPG
jgi:23S rRNA pseudouridine1911/1915/1917 synthase